ncbi:tRNA glutamyl-Q(34) synthetase GluQRS [Galactobacter sp.]|uniref:tRNA glutamyl-Q(34) synthetase GluQRS n=1 Tax=Galactobacter sp. TaxID=2676125 RepID=UPI0025B7AF5E|nr:tRNA glutamyl-Q(34) synthetase GluQRS [Galactobacter sp.]
MSGAGRYAPSPSGDLHIGNLRTAILAWLMARSTGRDLILRVEDLDTARTKAGAEQRQIEDLAAVGVTFDRVSPRQSERSDAYADAIATLKARGLLYECFCTRRDILEAPRAPHTPPGHYPGTCRNLTEQEKRRRRAERPAAWRLRAAAGAHVVGHDALLGELTGEVDDVVIQRNDGAPAYNLAVVVDDHSAQVDQVVRGDDLASSTPRQAYLRGLLYGEAARDEVTYVHVPLVLNAEGKRLAKRDGAVTLRSLADVGFGPERVRDLMLDSLGLPAGPLDAALGAFDLSALPREPWVFVPPS